MAGADDVVLVLDRFRQLDYDETTGDVRVGSGMRLGIDQTDPRSGDGTALCQWLHARGRALPNLGGVIFQTVAGFLATGTGGGSARYDAAVSVIALRLIDGLGRIHTLRRGVDDAFDAALVSAGSCGIVTEVTFRTEPAFDVAGTEQVLPDRGGPVDLFADGPTGLTAHFARTDYSRVLWWPQRRVRRIVVWSAHRVDASDPEPARPYQPVPVVLGSMQPAQIAGGAVLWGMTHWRRIRRWLSPGMMRAFERAAAPVEGVLYRAFVDGDPNHPQRFRGPWWTILPQDAEMDERWMPTTFTEIFVPLDRAAEAMRRLDDVFEADPEAAGRFAIEMYAAPASSSWLHPSYGRPSLRINVFWLMHSPDDPRDEFLPRIWNALEAFMPRLHWAKLFPHEPATMVTGRYPRMHDFLEVREQFDPDGVLLSTWLRAALVLRGPSTSPAVPVPRHRLPRGRAHWALRHALKSGTIGDLDSAPAIFDEQHAVPGSDHVTLLSVHQAMLRQLPWHLHRTWHSPENELDAALYDDAFVHATMRLRTIAYEPGRFLIQSCDRSSLPLGGPIVFSTSIDTSAHATQVRWRVVAPRTRHRGLARLVLAPYRAAFRAAVARAK